jgi:hypothetical protein
MNVSCVIIHVAYRGKNENPNQYIFSQAAAATTEIGGIPQHTRMSCLSQYTTSRTGTCSPAKPTQIRALNALGLILCAEALKLAIRWLARDIGATRKNSLSKFSATTHEKLTSTSQNFSKV